MAEIYQISSNKTITAGRLLRAMLGSQRAIPLHHAKSLLSAVKDHGRKMPAARDGSNRVMRLKSKIALISGAGRNIGKAIALAYAREGADVIVVAREKGEALDEVAAQCEKFGVKALPILADVGDSAQVEMTVQRGLEHFGKVDVLACVAALRPHKPFWEISYEEWDRVLSVNLNSTFYFAKALAPSMMERRTGGSIIALGGLASLTGQPLRAHVVASKTGLYGLIKALAVELGPFGVRANLIAVGHIDTERANPEWYPEGGGVPYMGKAGVDSDGSALGGDGSTPLRRLGSPQDVANVATFLASDESSFVTGDRIICAGGRYM
jgi:3-oxoacyl-[acyl-carrier protein] reductase